VRRFSASASLVTAKLPDATAAVAASCRRAQSYRLRRVTSAWYGTDSVRAACADRERALRDVEGVNRVLSGYFAALGALAGEKVPEAGAGVSALGSAVGEATDFDAGKVSAITALARFTTTHATDGYRRAALREAIAGQNANVQTVTSALHELLEEGLARYLATDGNAETDYYRSVLTESGAREPLGAILVRDSYDGRHAEVLEQTEAVRTLGRAMLTIGRGHQRLYDARDHLAAKELLASIVATARQLDAAMAKMDKAFPGAR
jgi:hypothetical protein